MQRTHNEWLALFRVLQRRAELDLQALHAALGEQPPPMAELEIVAVEEQQQLAAASKVQQQMMTEIGVSFDELHAVMHGAANHVRSGLGLGPLSFREWHRAYEGVAAGKTTRLYQ